MKYKNADYLARQERAQRAVSAVAKLAGWTFEDHGEVMPPALRPYRYCPTADVILIPWCGGHFSPILNALREIRCTVLLVMPGVTTIGTSTLYVSVIGWAKGEMCRHDELRLWSVDGRSFWLLPDPEGGSPDGPGFDLASGQLRPVMVRPWNDEYESGFGFGHADSVLMSMDAL